MNIDQSIHRMAVREAETLGLAHVIVARKRQELDLRLQRQRIEEGEAASGADIDDALRDMQTESEMRADDPAPENDTGVLVNKTA